MLRIGIDTTLAGIRESERGGVYQYLNQLLSHTTALTHGVYWKLMFALPHPRHRESIKAFADSLGARDTTVHRGWVPLRVLRRVPLPVECFTGALDVFHAPAHLSLNSRCPSIVTIHDLAYLGDRGGSSAPAELNRDERAQWQIRRRFFDEIARHTERSLNRATCVIAVSQATRQAVLQTFSVAAEKVFVVPLGVRDICRHIPSADETRRVLARYGLNRPYLFYLGGLDPNKNLATLLEGYALYRQRGGKAGLAIAGQSAFYGTVLKRLSDRLGLGDVCTFLGFVPDSELPVLYRSASAVVMPSPLEGFGLPALEAMACGVPVIAANAGALPEVTGDCAVTVDADSAEAFCDAMLRIQEDRSLVAALSQRGQQRAAGFTWRRSAEQTLAVYARAMGQPVERLLAAAPA